MIRNQHTRRRFRAVTTFLKWVEITTLIIFAVSLFVEYYDSYCMVDNCLGQSDFTQSWILQPLFTSFLALVFFVRTGVSFALSDPDDRGEPLFYLSLCGLMVQYILITFFFDEIITSRLQNTQGLPLLLVIIFIGTAFSLLADKATWDKTSYFVRLRITISLIHIITVIVSPLLSLLSALPFLVIGILWKDGSYHMLSSKDLEE